MKKTRKDKVIEFYNDKNNWRPPSYTQLMKASGIKSKNTIHKIIKSLCK